MTAPPVTSTDQTTEAADDADLVSPWASLRWGLVVSGVAAVLCTLVLEMSQLIGASTHWWATTFLGTAFLVDCLIVWLVLVVLIGLSNRVILPIGVVTAFVFIIAVANWVKLGIRAEPIYPSDVDFISEPGFLSSMVSPKSLIMAAVVVIVLIGGSILVARRYERRLVAIWPEHLPLRKQLVAVGVRAVIVTTAIALLLNTSDFNEHGNIWRKLYNLSGDRWRYWNQETNYQAHGFLGGFLYNMPTTAMKEPTGYSPETMAALTAKYTKAANKINRTRTGSLDHTNVVIILSESMSDPTRLKGFQLAQDPIPDIRNLMTRTTSGTMMTQLYGGGTANMEFETLTGQSIGLFTPQLSSPYQMLVSSYSKYPSAVGWFATHGHDPIAVHPYMTGMYKRNTVYKVFGFTKFIHDSTMAEAHKIDNGQYISDQSAFDEVERQINDTAEPLMVNLVTMQNHIPMNDAYHDPIPATGIGGSEEDRVSNYARGINHTDEALMKFLSDLRNSKEKTVVVFYGDHLPGIYSTDVRNQNSDLAIHETPFFLWSNRGKLAYKPQPVTSPIYFLPMLYQLANAPIPPYYAMLQQLRTQVAAIEQGRILTPTGEQVERTALPPRGQELLDDAQMIQYDFSIGKRYSVDQMWPGSLKADDVTTVE
jgi:phosphoglycerol transferase MdoB-like AlkP superfamily enzyme